MTKENQMKLIELRDIVIFHERLYRQAQNALLAECQRLGISGFSIIVEEPQKKSESNASSENV